MTARTVGARPDDLPLGEIRGRARLARLDGADGPVLVREYRKGGLLRFVRGRSFHGPWRPLKELVLHRRLQALGVPVVEAVGCVVLRGPFGWRGWLLTQEVEGAMDLLAWLHERPAAGPPARDVLREAGRAVRQLHDAGVSHADLHPKNLLLAPGGRVLVIDLDKAGEVGARLDDEGRLANLVRLGRAMEKHRLKGLRAGRREAMRFLEGYAGSREAARQWLDRAAERLRRDLRWRTLWWRLVGEARPWRSDAGAA